MRLCVVVCFLRIGVNKYCLMCASFVCVCLSLCVWCVWVYSSVIVFMHVCVYVCMCVRACVRVCMCLYMFELVFKFHNVSHTIFIKVNDLMHNFIVHIYIFQINQFSFFDKNTLSFLNMWFLNFSCIAKIRVDVNKYVMCFANLM